MLTFQPRGWVPMPANPTNQSDRKLKKDPRKTKTKKKKKKKTNPTKQNKNVSVSAELNSIGGIDLLALICFHSAVEFEQLIN